MYNMLIVDDNAVERNGITVLVKKLSLPIETFEAANGKQALEIMQEHRFDILFTDIRMPFIDGLDLIDKAKEFFPDLKCIIFSAYSDFEYARRAIVNGTDSYLLKPINISDFETTMQSVISDLEQKAMFRMEERTIIENMIHFSGAGSDRASTTVSLCIDKVFAAIDEKDFSSLSDLISEMFVAMREYNVASMLYVKQIVIEIIKALCEHMSNKNKNKITADISQIALCADIDDIQKFTIELTERITENIVGAETDEKSVSYTIDFALKCIRENYSKDISLDNIADELNISTGYFSRCFKKEVGQSFVKYLTQLRIDKAKEMLTQSNMKIKDISRVVGIPDLSYFGYIFKKYTGFTPDEYRRKYR